MSCPPDKIRNPATGRCVKKTGKVGKELLKRKSSPKRSPKSPKRSNPRTDSSSVKNNKNLFIHRHGSVMEDFLDNEFERLFKKELDKTLSEVNDFETRMFNEAFPDKIYRKSDKTINSYLNNLIAEKTANEMGYYIMRKLGSTNKKIQEKASDWLNIYMQRNYDILDIMGIPKKSPKRSK